MGCCFDRKRAKRLVEELEDVLIEEIKGAPSKVNKYYRQCKSRGKHDEEYCARVAWSIFCANVDPSHKSCTRYGRKWGSKNYSDPIS